VGQTGTLLRCVECGAESDQLGAGWRAYLAVEFDEDAREAKVVRLCPGCTERELGPSTA
jgi:hypothetical protein